VIARGLAAGFAGTCALTLSQRVEMTVSGRAPSDLPAQVAEGLYGISARGWQRELVAVAMHWVNNTSSGLGRAAVGAVGLRGASALAATMALYLGGQTLLFARLGLERPRPVDVLHAAVWASVTNAAYELLERGVDRDVDVPLQST
jgi:hypothetical protein